MQPDVRVCSERISEVRSARLQGIRNRRKVLHIYHAYYHEMAQGGRGQHDGADLARAVDEAVCFLDPDSLSIQEVTESAEALFGHTEADLEGSHPADLCPSDDEGRYRSLFDSLRETDSGPVSTFDDGRPIEVLDSRGDRIPVTLRMSRETRESDSVLALEIRPEGPTYRDLMAQNPFRKVVEATVNPIAAVDTSLRYIFANEAYCTPLGYDVEEIVGLDLESVLGSVQFEAIETSLEQALAGESVHLETERTYPSGETRVYEATYSPLMVEGGSVMGIIASFNDVTKRHERDIELERIFDGMEDAVFLHPVDGPFEVVNQTAVERYGYSEAELCRMSPKDLDVTEEVHKIAGRTKEIEAGNSIVFETAHETNDGEVIPVEISSSQIQYKGKPAALSIARDISRRKASERKFEVLFNNAADGIVQTRFEDGEPIIITVNPEFCDRFGVNETDVVGESLMAVFQGEANQFEIEEINRRITNGDHCRLEVQRQTPEGTRDFLLRSIPIDMEQNEYYRIYTDITERKERERMLVRQRDELKTLNRLNELILHLIQDLVESESRAHIESMICSELADSELYAGAWIGERHPETESVVLRARSHGPVPDTIDRLRPSDATNPGSEIAAKALDTGDIQVIQNTSADPRLGPGDGGGLVGSIRSLAAIPLVYQGSVYAVVVIYSPREYAFGGRELAGLETLGRIVEFALNAIKNRKLLTTDTVVELEFDLTDSTFPLVEVSEVLSCRLSLEGSVPSETAGTIACYLTVAGCDPDEFAEMARQTEEVTRVACISDSQGTVHRIEVTLDAEPFSSLVTRHKTSFNEFVIDRGSGTLTLDVPLSEDIRGVVDLVRSAYPGCSVVAKREREEDVEGRTDRSELQGSLTDRQYETLKNAHLAGYFEWPRKSTTEDIADALDITSATVQYHLRLAQQKIIDDLFE